MKKSNKKYRENVILECLNKESAKIVIEIIKAYEMQKKLEEEKEQ